MRRQICVCMAVCTAAVAVGASFPLEWNGTYATDVPYEVDVNTVKLARVAAAAPSGGLAVAATLPAGARVAIIDDVLATGGTLVAALSLVRRLGVNVVFNSGADGFRFWHDPVMLPDTCPTPARGRPMSMTCA